MNKESRRKLHAHWIIQSVTMALWILAYAGNAQPVNDLFAERLVITGTNILTRGSNVGASWESAEPNHAGEACESSVWWSWTAPASGSVALSTEGSGFDTILAVYIGSFLFDLIEVVSNDEDPNSYLTSRVSFEAVAGQTYAIAVDGYYGETGPIQLRLTYVNSVRPTNDLFANRTVIAGTNTTCTGSNVGCAKLASHSMTT